MTKLQNQIKAGEIAQQDGENIKNSFTSHISYTARPPIELNKVKKSILSQLNINIDDIKKINSKAFSDGGSIKCVKPDNKTTISFISEKKSLDIKISIKSTFQETQLSVHSLSTFKSYLLNLFKINLPKNVEDCLYWFTNDKERFEGDLKPNHSKEYFAVNNRRTRFSLDDIERFDSKIVNDLKDFFKKYAREIMTFTMSSGGATQRGNYADLIFFTDKKFDRVNTFDIDRLINLAINHCNKNPEDFVRFGLTKKNSGVTTLSLYGDLIRLQMKGSKKGTAAYHHLQFRISGARVEKLANEWGY